MRKTLPIFLVCLVSLDNSSKGGLLAAVEGFSHHGLNRPWDHSNEHRQGNERKQGRIVIRHYVENDSKTSGDDFHQTNTTSLSSKTQYDEADSNGAISVSSDHAIPSEIGNISSSSSSASLSPSPSSISYAADSKRSPTTPLTSTPSVRSCLPDLLAMMRPSNLPGVVLFHMLGIYLGLGSVTSSHFWTTLFKPSMVVTLMALLLTSSTSMLVNDYYDFKLGNDALKPFQPLNTPSRLPLKVVKRFLSYLYAGALLCVTIVPGIPARMAVVMGLMLTFWYTQHLKPRTWLKNVVCASLISLSPLTSGVAVMALTGSSNGWEPLLRVVAMLFVGILGREITMDINDVEDDSSHGVLTVPVVYGKKFASTIGILCTLGASGMAILGPFVQTVTGAMSKQLTRRWTLAILGATLQIRRGIQVFSSEGQDEDLVRKAVEEGLLTVVLLLASFV